MDITPQFIKDLCTDWVRLSTGEGGIAIDASSERKRLLANGIQYHYLNYECLNAAILGLSRTLLLPGLNTVVVDDHFGLWAWCAEIFVGRESTYFDMDEMEIKSLFEASIRASLTSCRKPALTAGEHAEQVKLENLLPHNARYYLHDSSLVLAYITFPLLEAILKKSCNRYLDMDGKVVTEFNVLNKANKTRKYKVGTVCSSIRDELFLLHNKVANAELKENINEFRGHITTLDPKIDPFDLIYKWRNQSLHGTSNYQTIGGTLLNLVLLIVLHAMKDNFNSLRRNVLARLQREAQFANDFKSRSSFYPPH